MQIDSEEVLPGIASRFCLFVARFCSSAWIGAATLFVIVGVTEVTRAGFDSTTKDILVAVRFPAFYCFGSLLVGLATLGCWLAGNSAQFSKTRRIGSLVFLALVLALIAIDYFWIYRPLLGMVSPPGRPKPELFIRYHEASKWINLVGLTLCLIASTLLNWPAKPVKSRSDVS